MKAITVLIPSIFAMAVTDACMRITPLFQAAINVVLIRVNTGTWRNGRFDQWLDRPLGGVSIGSSTSTTPRGYELDTVPQAPLGRAGRHGFLHRGGGDMAWPGDILRARGYGAGHTARPCGGHHAASHRGLYAAIEFIAIYGILRLP